MSIAVIAGTGIETLGHAEEVSEIRTPYGPAYFSEGMFGGRRVVVLRRHGPGLNIPPHLINYRANIWALREAGVKRIIATAAVGSIRKDLCPTGALAVVGDFIDFTKRREFTFMDSPRASVLHLDFSVPYCPEISSAIERAASQLGIPMARRVTYVCVEGPRYETPAEIRMFGQWGGDVVGMTGAPEVILAREMGMCYASLAIITNHAAGVTDRLLSHEDVLASVRERSEDVRRILDCAVAAPMSETHRCVSLPSPDGGPATGESSASTR